MKKSEGLKVAVVGATGAVGQELLKILRDRQFPVSELVPFASARSVGKRIEWRSGVSCRAMTPGCFNGIDIAFFDASDAVSKEWVPQAAEQGAWVVDNSGAFRMESDIPLLVPEVNGELVRAKLQAHAVKPLPPRQRILAGPNCAAAPLALALLPIHQRWGLERVVVSTYQSTSGAGAAASEELRTQTRMTLQGEASEPKIFPHPIAFNCIPHIGRFLEGGETSEEHKIIEETQKILNLPHLRISATAIRVPTFSCHAESVNIECRKPFEIEEVKEVLRGQAVVILQDTPANQFYPLGVGSSRVEGASGRDAVYVGRVRRDPSLERGLNLWLVSDNLRKGAALNAVQVGEFLLPLWL